MNGWSEPENDVALLRAELDACRTEIAVLRRQVDIERSNNRALRIHLDETLARVAGDDSAEVIARLNATVAARNGDIARLKGLLGGRD